MPPLAIPSNERAPYRALWDRLRAAQDILLVSPKRPDGDSLGSICGMWSALRFIGKSATLFCVDPAPPTYGMLPGIHMLAVGAPALHHRTFDVIIVVDAGDLDFAGIRAELPQWKRSGGALVVIDHHATNTRFGDVNCVITTAASTTEVITRILQVNAVPITPATATALLFGLVYDTDGFSNPATSVTAAATAAALLAAGAQMGPILRAQYRSKPIGSFQLWGRAFERLVMHPRWQVATTVLLPEDFAACGAESTEGLANFLQNVLPAKAVLVLKDSGTGMVRGSFRTLRNDVDLGALAEHLGGGGHRKASGFGVPGRVVREGDRWRVVVQ
ncbi:DHH family phosphoesterase [Candidatus Uhrbacteria bacterium]|nr:DHH family phosphoesterase [Candidatus Uhrbacteria bacterium]